MIELRPYQQEIVDTIKDRWTKKKKHLLICAPTGSGKTIIFTHISKLVSDRNKKVIIFTDRAELLKQTGSSLKKFGLSAYFIEAGCKVVSNAFNCYVAMSQTFRRRIDKEYWKEFLTSCDLVVIDECHKQEFNYLFESGLLDNMRVLGFSATPERSGKMRQLGLDYEEIIETVTVNDLIEQGYLVPDDFYGCGSPDMDGVEIDRMKGDYKENQMFKKFDSPQLYAGVVKNYENICPSTKTLAFCVNIEHTIRTALEFHASGYAVRFIVSKLSKPKKPINTEDLGAIARYGDRLRVYELLQKNKHLTGKREDVFKWFDETKEGILVNAGIATTGFDQPDIETVIINRATMSKALLLQIIGRGSRISGDKTHFNILDFGGNCERLGYYTEPRFWSLWHEEKGGDGIPPVKICGKKSDGKPVSKEKGCDRLILASYKICPFCGFKYPEKEFEEIDLVAEFYDQQKKRSVKTKLLKDMTVEELSEQRRERGRKMAWLWRQLWYKGKEKAIEQLAKSEGWSNAAKIRALEYCKKI